MTEQTFFESDFSEVAYSYQMSIVNNNSKE